MSKTLKDKINDHPIIVYGGAILVIIGLIEYAFGRSLKKFYEDFEAYRKTW